MSKKLVITILSLMTLSFITVGSALAAISGSAHDFSSDSWNSSGQICIVCHTPHNAKSTIAPLWNHKLSTQTYTLYTSSSLDATLAQPSSSSKACLSCHDGTVALDSFGNNTGGTLLTGGENVGIDLSNDHPVSFVYDATLALNDGGLRDPSTPVPTLGTDKTIASGMLIGGKLECGSCHDVHANKGDAGTASNLLLVSNTGSALCLTCHDK